MQFVWILPVVVVLLTNPGLGYVEVLPFYYFSTLSLAHVTLNYIPCRPCFRVTENGTGLGTRLVSQHF